MSYLNSVIVENMVVPVSCETKRGTAFFISPTQLLTARHVVKAHFQSAATPVYIMVAGRHILCRAEELSLPDDVIDLALLTIISEQDYQSEDYLQLLCDDFIKDLPLHIYGYPDEVAMGMNLVDIAVRNRLKIEGGDWNDRALVRDDKLHLQQYDGLSGSPVVSKSGRVVGIVVLQINETLSYLSIAKAQKHLNQKGISYDTDWTKDDITTLGPGRSFIQCKEAAATVHDRYMPKLHQRNEELDSILDFITDRGAAVESERKAIAMAEYISKLPEDMMHEMKDWLKIGQDPGVDLLSENSFALLQRCQEYIETYPSQYHGHWEIAMNLSRLSYELNDDNFNRLRMRNSKSLCLIGKAGSGKTHNLCEYATKNQDKANIYLFFGTDFSIYETAISHIKDVVCQDMTIEDFNKGLKEKGRYAVVVIDALNEGLGCNYWNHHLGALRTELERHDHFRLVVSVRTPFDKDLNDLAEISHWHVHYIEGFVDLEQAVYTYFQEYDVDRHYLSQKIEAFKNPLFLKIFCETYHTMTSEERIKVNKRMLYKRYVAKKNGQVSNLVDEDHEINIADKFLSKLANYSTFYSHFNPISRGKARQYAKRMEPYRLWKNDLLHACLTANLLLEDRSHTGESAVMYEYENLGDYYKAEQLLKSKMDTGSVLRWIDEERKYFERNPEVPSEKYKNAVKALFDCWYQEKRDVCGEKLVQKGGPLYELYYESLIESDIPTQQLVKMLLQLDHDEVNPIRLIQKFDEVSLDETMKIHTKLKGYPTVGNRDLIWTRYVNQMYEMYGDDYIGEVPVETDHTLSVCDDERQYIICITWMLSSSHPKFRAIIIRKLRKILHIHQMLIPWLMELFNDVNDPYVLSGMYCAICGVVLPSRDKKVVANIAEKIYHQYYEHDEDVPQDLIVRQWTLKIIERAYHLDKACDYWIRIKTPFAAHPIDMNNIPAYPQVRQQKSYFGLHHGSIKMHNSIFSIEDFNRYIIGTNSSSSSSDYFVPTENGKYQGVMLTDIMAEMAYYIMEVFGWNDKLGYLDNGKYSPDRSHNDQERIGKKFQWLAWYRVNARLMDACRTSREQYYYNHDEAGEEDLTMTPYPWNSSEISRFDPTLDVEYKMPAEAGLSGIEKLPIAGKNDAGWIKKKDYLPVFRCFARHEDGGEYVMLMGYDTVKENEKETFLFSNSCFVRNEDTYKFEAWAKVQNFYGRWMPERRGMIEYLWNDYPWADEYQSTYKHEAWSQPHDCPCEIMLSYEAQLQEDWEGIGRENEYHSTAYMPCEEMVMQMGLYCSEVRGVVKSEADDSVVALNTGHGNCINGLFIRRDILNDYLQKMGYVMFYYVLGEKVLRIGEMNAIFQDLSGAYRYREESDIEVVQELRVEDREEPKPIKANPKRAAELRIKNEAEGLTTREMIELTTIEKAIEERNKRAEDYKKLLELESKWDDEIEDEE